MAHFVVIGAGQAGASLVAKLRSEGFDGQITLIGAEPLLPYQRPPLSKAYLLGEMALERLFLRPADWYEANNIALHTNSEITAINPADKTITLAGEMIRYDALALTTGARPRQLPAAVGGTLDSVYVVRDLRDADAMAPEISAGRHVLIIGGGYIGLEAAAVAAKRGVKVTLIEMGERILQRVACQDTSDYFRALHRSHGVEIIENIGLDKLLGDKRVTGAKLSDGRELAIDFAIVGIGVIPETALAEAAGLGMENGIATDAYARSSDPYIWAAGDCASTLFNNQRIRIESVGNAIDMAEIAALNMMGQKVIYKPKPWFWSDQYACKLQIAGLNIGYDGVHVRRGENDSVSHWYYRGDVLLAVDAMNDARNYMIGKRLIEMGKSPDPAVISDPETDMKALLKS